MKKILLPLILILCLVFNSNVLATPWDVSTANYANKYKDVSGQEDYPYGLFFKSDGTKMYIVGVGTATVYQYSLLTAWDTSTATYENKYKDVSSQDSASYGVFFRFDGFKMYIVGEGFPESNPMVHQYALSTAWDVSTASYEGKYKYVGNEDEIPYDLFFSSDGYKMYVVGYWTEIIYQYNLSTAWDVSTASYESKYKDVGSEDNTPVGLFFKPDGLKMYFAGGQNCKVYQYALSTAWDVSTTSYESKYKDVSSQDGAPCGLFFTSDGLKMYVMGYDNVIVYQYSLPVGWPHKWNTQTISKWNTKEIMKWNDLE